MDAQTDAQLLQAYAERRSDAAFAELVRRHIDLVHSAARRMVGDTHLAEDVTQATFLALSKNAAQLTERPVLAGWLHRTAQNIAAQTVRTDVRRRAREQEAAAMNELLSENSGAGVPPAWAEIAPHLDAALGDLTEPERDAVLLRYFQRQSARDMAQTLGISNEAAQKRVSRAVDRLREFFAKRGVTVGASGLAVVISANAVQAAPVGLALTISTAAALTGPTLATTTTVAATKAIAMTTLQKTVVTATIAVLAGAGIYEARQAAQLRGQVQTLQQQQAPLSQHNADLNQALMDATNQLAALRADNERLNQNTTELLKLRGEVGLLRKNAGGAASGNSADTSTSAAARSWLQRVAQLKEYVEKNPTERIPEFQFLTDREWLQVADAGLDTETFEKEDDYDRAVQNLRFQAESRFARNVQAALRKFSSTTSAQFPTAISQLEPYCDPIVLQILTDLYEIQPASLIPESERRHINVKFDWFITRKSRVSSNTTSRLAIFPDGDAYWQSPP